MSNLVKQTSTIPIMLDNIVFCFKTLAGFRYCSHNILNDYRKTRCDYLKNRQEFNNFIFLPPWKQLEENLLPPFKTKVAIEVLKE